MSVAFLHERHPSEDMWCDQCQRISLHALTACQNKEQKARGNDVYIHGLENNIKRLRNGPPPQSQPMHSELILRLRQCQCNQVSSSMWHLHWLPFPRRDLHHIDSPKNTPSTTINISLYTQLQLISPPPAHISIIQNNLSIFPSFRFLSSSQSSECLALRSRSNVSNSPPKSTLLHHLFSTVY